ncbi:MAG: DUF349 domain-containing protein [Acidiferrobacterales bacterium]|nr:DUF349 domain-containing protein [Acidiferrobacterales bacterium]
MDSSKPNKELPAESMAPSGEPAATQPSEDKTSDNALPETQEVSSISAAEQPQSTSDADTLEENVSDASDQQSDTDPVQSESPDKSEEVASVEEQTATEATASSDTADGDKAADIDCVLGQVEALCERLSKELENGQLRECISLYEKAQAKLSLLTDSQLDSKRLKKVRKRINSTYAQVRELKDWRHWGIQQSRLDVITKLENLAGYEGNPLHLNSQIKELRELWSSWIQAGDFPNRAMRERFSNAYEEAFKPCKAYFKQHKQQRKANKKIRKQISNQLEDYYESVDWNQPDWSAITNTIRDVRKKWKKAVPLNKKDWNSTNARLEEVIGKFEPHLERERKKGVSLRLGLIEQAESLDSEPVKVATEKVKQLQQEWKAVKVRDKKKTENELWDRFRIACDRQFQRRTEIRKSFEDKQRKSANAKKALLADIQEINKLPIDQIKSNASEVSAIQRKWNSAGAPGRKSRSPLDHEFKREVSKFRESIRELKRLETEAVLSVLESKAKLCDELELYAVQGKEAPDLHHYRDQWDSFKDQCGEFENAIRNRFESACAICDGSDADRLGQWQRNLEIKQEICLKLEILSKLDSPPEFARDRMQTNILRLKTAMVDQGATADPETEIQDLLVNYWLTGAVPEQAYESLSKRFATIREELSKSS